jgi:TPR repeat protein
MSLHLAKAVAALSNRLAVAALCVLAACCAAAAADSVPGRRAALVIGNAHYQSLPELDNALNDADRIGKVLREANFEVTVGHDLTKAGLEKTVRAFLQTLNDGDVALFYYSGHAVQVAGENFILPVDASLSSSYDLEVESYNVSSLLDYMRAASKLQILVLDACRDNPFPNGQYFLGERKVKVGARQGLASISPKQGTLIVYSTAPDEVAYDGEGDASPFAKAFSDHVLTPNREVRDVLTMVRKDVVERTQSRQVPWDASSLTSQFFFVSAQNVLTLDKSVTEVRVPPDRRQVDLRIQPPVASGGMRLSFSFDRQPQKGLLLLDGKTVKAGAPVDVGRIGDVVYVTDPGPKPVEFIPYTISADTGQTASGAVAIVFDAAAPGTEVIADNGKNGPAEAEPVRVTLVSDAGTGFAAVPALDRSAGEAQGWLKVAQRDGDAQLAVNDRMLIVGDVVPARDLAGLKVRMALHAEGPARIVLAPVGPAQQGSVVIGVDARTNECDTLAAEPLDIQAVTEGVLPNDIRIPEALAACSKAVADFPDVARFKFQYGRVLYADGRFDEALTMVRAAIAGGHVRASQFLGRLFQLGSGVALDPAAAVPLFETASRRGDPYGQYSLAKALIEGNGTEADVGRGMGLLQKAAESGHTYALNQLGSEYLSGKRVAKDVGRAYVMFEKSAGRGDVWGEVNLGLMYRDGLYVERDEARARRLFTEANGKLHPYAATLIALLDRADGRAEAKTLLPLFRESAARGDGWGAFYAAEIVGRDAALAEREGEAVHLYALAAARNAGKASAQSREKLAALSPKAVAEAVQQTLRNLGATGIAVDGKLGPKAREAAAAILDGPPPSAAEDLLIALVRLEWVRSMPRLDML